MGSMVELSDIMNGVAFQAQPPEPFPTYPNHTQDVQDILHCLIHYGTPGLHLGILHRVEGIFGHHGAYRHSYEVLGNSLESQWICDSLTSSTPEQESRRHDIALGLLKYCRKDSSGPPLPATTFMRILNLGYAFAHHMTIADIQNGALCYPVDQQGRVDWQFEQSQDLLETLRNNYYDIKFHHEHPCGDEEILRWTPGTASNITGFSAAY